MAKRKINDYIFHQGIPYSENLMPNAYWLIQNNVEFIVDEVREWINYKILNANSYTPTDVVYTPGTGVMVITIGTHNIIPGDAIRIATNGLTFTCARDNNASTHSYPRATGVPNSTGHDPSYNTPVEVLATTSTTITVNVGISSDSTVHTFVGALPNAITDNFDGYVNDSDDKCERDMRYNLIGGDEYNTVTDQPGGLLHDIRYGGNEQARYLASKYWDRAIPQIDGDRWPEKAAKAFARLLINDYILTNTAFPSRQSVTTQTINSEYIAESGAGDQVTKVLVDTIGKVIVEGTSFMPDLEHAKISRCLFPTKVTQDNLLLITNTTNNNVLFNFSDPSKGASTKYVYDSVEFTPTYEYFSKFLETTDTITQVLFDVDTRNNEYLPNSRSLIANNKEFLKDEVRAWIADNVANASAFTPTNVVYTPLTGVMVITLGAGHGLDTGDYIRIAPNSLTFTCAMDNHATEHNYPRASGSNAPGGRDYAYDSALPILAADATTVTVNVGVSTNKSEHIFVEADTNSVYDIWYNYTYNSAKCERDTGFNLDAIALDLQYGGNTNVRDTASKYWVGPTPQIDGSRVQEIKAKEFLRDLINNFILPKSVWPTKQTGTPETTQYFGNGVAELGTGARITELIGIITTVIENGLGFLPTEEQSTIWSENDTLSIFVDQGDLKTRPYDFGTDAIERHRVANALSMLDADFEYGLQPTKWQAIGTMRGYPSTYEVPGTDTAVQDVVTDASDGSSGVGQSLITVTTVGPHGVEPGQPITIRGLDGAVQGNGRAEGTFIVNTAPTNNTFTYYAKAKVGTVAGTSLVTFYTILRQAAFYTGADIQGDTPSYEVTTQGSAGSFSLALGSASGQDRLAIQGNPPELGAPLVSTGGGIPLGSQVTGSVGAGGIITTPTTTSDTPQGSFTIDVENASAVEIGSAVDRGDATAAFVTQVVGNTLTIDTATTRELIGNNVTYTGLTGANDSSIGNGATFDVTRTTGVYNVTIADTGQDYQIGDNIVISGGQVGGADGINDIRIIIETVDTGGEVLTFTFSGDGFDGNGTFFTQSGELQGGTGTGGNFDVTYTNNVYTATISSPDTSSGYTIGDVLRIDGFELGGTSVTNDLTMTVDAIGVGGSITSVVSSGTAVDADVSYPSPTRTSNTVAGVDADFNIQRIGTSYFVTITNGGSGYLAAETFTVLGSELGGTDGINNATVTITSVGVSGDITGASVAGTAANTKAYPVITTAQRVVGNGAEFTVDLANGTYTLTLESAGQNYGVDQELIIRGTNLGGASPTNDVTITVTAVQADGGITTYTFAGTGATGSGSYNAVIGQNDSNAGSNAVFDITRSGGNYTLVIATDEGSGYKVGDRIIIPGDELGGATPTNDLTLRCTLESTEGNFVGISASGTAVSGDTLDLYSSVTMSEETTSTIAQSTVITYSALASIRITFNTPHGLVPGDSFAVTVGSDDGSNNHALAAGPFSATAVPSLTTLEYQCRSPGFIDTGTNNDTPIIGNVYPRPDSFFIHRPYDGGVQLGTGGPQHGAQAIRQSKKYIRYQSGKGIMYTTGALFAPSYNILNITSDGTVPGSTITVTTDETEHGLQVGGIIKIIGVDTLGYNGTYTVTDVNDENEFEVIAHTTLGSTNPELSSECQVSLSKFHGATVRSGAFDDQNGIFFEYDGTQFSAVQRTATLQLAGVVDIEVDANTVTGSGTRFREQLKAGDRIVLKGMTHVVTNVVNNTTMYVAPDFRGVTDVRASKICLVRDKKTEQKNFNKDRGDGTGPSGYNIDISKMQMVGIQYSWYGAGFIDYMLRGSNGEFVFMHRMRNSNVNTEAFMRTGNMPVRYEITNEGPSGKLSQDMDDSQQFIPLQEASFFPPDGGVVYIDGEMIRFTGISGKNLTGCTRAATMTNFASGATRTYSGGGAEAHTRNTGVVLISNTASPNISHWGSAFITDGGFDSDRGYLFSYKSTGVQVTTTRTTSFLLRLAPSVSNALVGDLGERELLNRAQLLLEGLEITTDQPTTGDTGGIVIEGILNPQNYPLNPSDVGWQGLSGLAQGGQPSFAQVAPGGSTNWNSGDIPTTADVTTQAPITASITGVDRGYRSNNDYWDNAVRTGRNFFWIQESFYSANTDLFQTGIEIDSPTYFPAGTTITQIGSWTTSSASSGTIRPIYLSSNGLQNVTSGNVNLTFKRTFKDAPTNNIFFNKTSFENAGVAQGTNVSDTRFPAGTQVTSLTLESYNSTEYYSVVFNQTSDNSAITAGTTTIEFEFVQPPFAQPGETIFSFIAQPGERSTLDLSFIKELTNTTLGGRGTFPNGPDVLAINVYKTSGAGITSNIVLRWSEAQA